MEHGHCSHNNQRIEELMKYMAAAQMEHQSFKRRIDDLENKSERQNDILLTLQKQAAAIEAINGKIDGVASSVEKMSQRVEQIEKEPADKWKKISFEVIKYLILAVLGAFVGYFIK